MKQENLKFNTIKSKYPNEWVLLGNPVIADSTILNGKVIHHSKDKRIILNFAKKVIDNYEMIKIVFTGATSPVLNLGVYKVTESK